jgi:hypothetical protein
MSDDTGWNPADYTVAEVLDYLEEHPDERDAVLAAEQEGKARKGVLEAEVDDGDGGPGPLQATTTKRQDYLGRDLLNEGTTATDYMGLATTSTADYTGRLLIRDVRANTTAVSLGQLIQFTTGQDFTVTTAGTTAASPPTVPAVGATVADGTAVLTRTR